MWQTLHLIPYQQIAGQQVFGWGLLACLVCGLMLMWQFLRTGWSAETRGQLVVTLLVGVASLMLPRVFPAGVPIRGYGVMLLLGVISGVALAIVRGRRRGITDDTIVSLAFWMFVLGIVCARLFYVIEYWEREYADQALVATLLSIANIPQGGLVVYGSFFGASVAVVLFARKYQIPVLALADLIAPSLMLGLALGRIGCLANGCCFGSPNDVLPWTVRFPQDSPPYLAQLEDGSWLGFTLEMQTDQMTIRQVRPASAAETAGLQPGDKVLSIGGRPATRLETAYEQIANSVRAAAPLEIALDDGTAIRVVPPARLPERSLPVHPTQVYSAINALLICGFLLAAAPFCHRDGMLFALLLSIYPLTRFLLEAIRTDEAAVFDTGLSISQNVSIVLFATVIGLWIWVLRRPPRLDLQHA